VDTRLKGTRAGDIVRVRDFDVQIPAISRKFFKFVSARRSIFGEIASMSKVNGHQNCLKLQEVLEMVHDSRSTIFLVLELAIGGELFDRIQVDRGTDSDTARHYFRQLLFGLAHCHAQGVCHRDLKPENLLLADNNDNSVLKIADFGLSALFRNGILGGSSNEYRRLKSVVGSPHYVAPEVLKNNDGTEGYDGAKADVWSAGVILYAMLAGNLPFGKEILQCPRFSKWKQWTRNRNKEKVGAKPPQSTVTYPSWFFPSHFSLQTKSLLTALLEPDPSRRMSVLSALRQPWLADAKTEQQLLSLQGDSQKSLDTESKINEASGSKKPEPAKSVKPPMSTSALGVLKPSIPISAEQDQEESTQNLSTSSHDQQCPSMPMSNWAPSDSLANGPNANANDDILKPNRTPARTRHRQSHPTLFSSPPLAPRSSLCNELDDLDDLDDGGPAARAIGMPALDLSRASPVGWAPSTVPVGSDDLTDLPPKFQDLVKRSTRFSTRVPAAEVISKIADIIAKDEHPLPFPHNQIRQKVKVDLSAYRLEVTRGSILVCTVQMFLLHTGLYIVEFTRGQLEIFQFKRFYENVRGKLSQIVKKDYNNTIRQLDTLPFRSRFKGSLDEIKSLSGNLKRTNSSHR